MTHYRNLFWALLTCSVIIVLLTGFKSRSPGILITIDNIVNVGKTWHEKEFVVDERHTERTAAAAAAADDEGDDDDDDDDDERDEGDDDAPVSSPEGLHQFTKPITNPHLASLNTTLLLYGIDLGLLQRNLYNNATQFRFLSNYKNPCWVELLPRDFLADYNRTAHADQEGAREPISRSSELFEARLQLAAPWRLRCLPYFYLSGVTKSGTTDLFDSLLAHPDIFGPWVKEPMYWNRRRYPLDLYVEKVKFKRHIPFRHYLNNFDWPAHLINQSVDRDWANFQYHSKIIGDGSSYLFWEDDGWTQNPGNQGLDEPLYTSPKALATLQPDAKIIVLLRNPTDRLYSAYCMYAGRSGTRWAFSKLVDSAIRAYNQCFHDRSVRICLYNITLANLYHPVSLRSSIYSVFLRDWLEIFPREQIKVVISEDHYTNRVETLRDIFDFLGVSQMTSRLAAELKDRSPSNQRTYDQPLHRDTVRKLDSFFQPFITELEGILRRRPLWNRTSTN